MDRKKFEAAAAAVLRLSFFIAFAASPALALLLQRLPFQLTFSPDFGFSFRPRPFPPPYFSFDPSDKFLRLRLRQRLRWVLCTLGTLGMGRGLLVPSGEFERPLSESNENWATNFA